MTNDGVVVFAHCTEPVLDTGVYVGPRHTVVVSELLVVRADGEPISADLDQRLIDLALDPRLQ